MVGTGKIHEVTVDEIGRGPIIGRTGNYGVNVIERQLVAFIVEEERMIGEVVDLVRFVVVGRVESKPLEDGGDRQVFRVEELGRVREEDVGDEKILGFQKEMPERAGMAMKVAIMRADRSA